MSAPTTTDPSRLTAQYEELRAQAVSGSAALATPLGLAVFLRRGLAAWLAVCIEMLGRSAPPPDRPLAAGGPRAVLPTGLHAEAVRVLASMALAGCQKGG
jgi:hypothetical protein